MRKWTYLVASLLLGGAAPLFTGCIDNDEPEGITILRGAKAELLNAQAALERARVAEVEANAALTNAKAKVQERTPAFTVIQGASVPQIPAGPKRTLFVLFMLFLTFTGTLLYVLKSDIVSQFRS